jgi:chorismate mutase
MPADSASLDKVRREIDAVDDALHDNLMRRAALIVEVMQAKQGNGETDSAMRPGREARILRRIAARHGGDLPLEVVFRIWREVINAATAMQGPISVAVCAPEKSAGYWDLARNHFGASTPMTLHVAPSVVMRNVVDRPGTVGILPEPQDEEKEPWWPMLASEARGGNVPRIIWRLPFFASPSGRFEELGALVVYCMRAERSGQDVTVAAFDCDLDVSRGRLLEALEGVGLSGRVVTTHQGEMAKGRLHLVLIDDFVAEDDDRLVQLTEAMDENLYRAVVLGAYPEPIQAPGATA